MLTCYFGSTPPQQVFATVTRTHSQRPRPPMLAHVLVDDIERWPVILHHARLVLRRDFKIDHITLQELLRVVRNPRSTLVDHDAAKPLPAVDALRAELQRASDEALQGRTLGSWVAGHPE